MRIPSNSAVKGSGNDKGLLVGGFHGTRCALRPLSKDTSLCFKGTLLLYVFKVLQKQLSLEKSLGPIAPLLKITQICFPNLPHHLPNSEAGSWLIDEDQLHGSLDFLLHPNPLSLEFDPSSEKMQMADIFPTFECAGIKLSIQQLMLRILDQGES